MRKKQEIISGIYFIQILDKFYIGECGNIFRRWRMHIRRLLNNCHENPHLQHSFNKYGGMKCVSFVIFRENITNEAIRKRYEQYLIYKFNAIKLGFNIKPGLKPCAWQTKNYFFKHLETGEEFRGNNISQFSREMGFAEDSLSEVMRGKAKICYPLYCPDRYTPTFHTLRSPDGEKVKFFRMTEFHKTYPHLNITSIFGLIRGTIGNHKGWTRYEAVSIAPKNKKCKLINPNGEVVIEDSIKNVCDKYNLCRRMVSLLVNNRINEYKGWKLYKSKIKITSHSSSVSKESYCLFDNAKKISINSGKLRKFDSSWI